MLCDGICKWGRSKFPSLLSNVVMMDNIMELFGYCMILHQHLAEEKQK